ncbi:MAG: HD domain-containing protein [Candidatus Scalindua rubra]|nr:HD domain-containing protein [Candidatus Scalindua rubra]TWU31645.1 Cyclic di-GMP phosphodiesterase response regulator RpfG [Candidatus Brocadiaceae bacterium S225]
MAAKPLNYFPVAIKDLKVNTILDFDIFIQTSNNIVLFRKQNLPFTEETLNNLAKNKVTTIFVSEDDRGKIDDYCHSIENTNNTNTSNDCFTAPFDNPENLEKYYKTYLDYYPIEKANLLPGSRINFNVYKKSDLDVELFVGPDKHNNLSGIVPKDIHNVQSAIAIHKEDIPLYKEYINNLSLELSKSKKDSSALSLKYSILRENSKFIIKDIFEDPGSGETIQKAGDLVATLTDTILENQNNFSNLLKITTHDYYTYTHSLNVCSLSIGLGTELKLRRDPDLLELGLGALLHDLGKCTIDLRILNKPGKLTGDEFKEIQSHVTAANALLTSSNTEIPKNSLATILQHHEKMSGKGYPYKLNRDQIHINGRIGAIVDFYDALTTERPYKKAFSPFQAFQLLSEFQDDYDKELIKMFIVMLGKQV